ncbi:MAG: hypothetical protein LIO90_02415, partial [Bacteroidales bacterium]|nr:hypothetical protein [Bacteroidales bacterium]
TTPSYQLDNTTMHLTCGLGYRYQNFYFDAAYVYKHRKSTFHAYTPNDYTALPPQAEIRDNNSQLVFSIGFKF